jgi:hypothetical protein
MPRFLEAMEVAGLHPRESIAEQLAAHQLALFSVDGDAPGCLGGWAVYILDDDIPAGAFGHYRLGVHGSWCMTSPRSRGR